MELLSGSRPPQLPTVIKPGVLLSVWGCPLPEVQGDNAVVETELVMFLSGLRGEGLPGSPGQPPGGRERGWMALTQPCLVKQAQAGKQPRSNSPDSWCGAVSGTPQGAPNGLLSIWGEHGLLEKWMHSEKDWQTPDGKPLTLPQRTDRKKQPCG